MKYKRFVYTPVILIVATVRFISGSGDPSEIRRLRDRYSHASNLERIVAMWNRSAEASHGRAEERDRFELRSHSVPDFPADVSKCIEDHQYQITENFSQGKNIILNCFKTSLMLSVLGGYLGHPSKSAIKLFNGMLEFKKIPEKGCADENCERKHNRNFGLHSNKKNEYIRMYKKAMHRLAVERSKYHSYRNLTEEEKARRLSRIDENSQAFLSEVIRNLGDEAAERREEEKLAKEITDPRFVSVLDALTRNYMVKLRFYPGVTARMMRSNNGGFTFDLEIPDSDEVADAAVSSDESLTREIKDTSEPVDYSEEDVSDSRGRKKSKKDKYKRKILKKKWKGLKKFLPYLILPIVIQVTLLPFVFKKLFFLAMKALMAGKVALILVGFNLLRNTCIQNDDFQRIRVEHYGYRRGGEYGAWINGRSLGEPSLMSALSEEPYGAHRPVSE